MIKKFIVKTILVFTGFLIILLIVLLASSAYVKSRNFKNSQTESNTLFIKADENFDLMFMGISHARNFSRYGNHEILEKMLKKKTVNIGQGEGKCGLNEQLFYLNYFYSENNKVDTIFFILSPPMLTSDKLPFSTNTFNEEVFNLKFCSQYLLFDTENKYERMIQYGQSKLKASWIDLMPNYKIGKFDSLKKIDLASVKKGVKFVHGESINTEIYNKACLEVEKIVKTAKENKSEIIMIIPPALFGKWPEHELAIDLAKKMKTNYNVKYYDFSESVLVPEYYYDHHHLNTNGVKYFAQHFLKPLL
ncbi:hypothetical protein [Flavobacterium sp. N1736]|uniref:hypothetical protein n=1 Tax=Flavobacterium sp. N1736 TaxID=2986823 RepID=UPI002225B4B3|nr:hypothetical protein [Flavobacterium sp. N1736]